MKEVTSEDENHENIVTSRERWSDSSYEEALKLYDNLKECSDSYISSQLSQALNNLDHAFRLYGPESVICSFNGGKDAVVILHLVRAAQAHHYRQRMEQGHEIKPFRPRVIYFENKDEFPEILDFVRHNVEQFDLDMIAFEQGIGFSDGLKIVVESNKIEGSSVAFPVAFVLGTRTSDPNARGQAEFAPSSHYMPPFMRVNPVINWTYGHVWHFLRLFHLPYCSLYDQGYTSLGTVKDTLPCPALAIVGSGDVVPKFWPAYMLRDWDQERAGRIPKDKLNSSKVNDDATSVTSRATRLSAMTVVPNGSEIPQEIDRLDVFTLDDQSVVSYNESLAQRTVGILVIGDEILKGLTGDTNTLAAAKALRDHNVLLKRVVVASDNLDDIIQEICRMQSEVDVIITSGGVGPTHDDVTMKSVAEALNCEMVLHDDMAQLLRDKMNEGEDVELTEAQVKMATLPQKAKLRYLSENPSDWPVLQCSNIFILPGVPEFFEKKIENVAKYLSCQLERSIAYKVVLSADETSIVSILNDVVAQHPDVSFGSYPFLDQSFKTVITVEAKMLGGLQGGRRNSTITEKKQLFSTKQQMDKNVQRALDQLINLLPKDSVLRVDNDDSLNFS